MASNSQSASPIPKSKLLYTGLLLPILTILPAAIVISLLQPEGFYPSILPDDYNLISPSVPVPEHFDGLISRIERVGDGLLPGPEDLAYDEEEKVLYTGCLDGWIKKVKLGEDHQKVENWTFVGGRPLGLAFTPEKKLVVAEANKGLLLVKGPDQVELLTDEAEGVKFKLTDGVDVASDGTIYFTDASYKYNIDMHMLDILEGRPHGRLMSYNPSTKKTVVLVRDLYFANGIALSPDENTLIFCETSLRRCKQYHIRGEKEGTVGNFINNLPGFPDNIHYTEGHYWIALSAGRTKSWDFVLKYPWVRKMMVALAKYVTSSELQKGSGILCVSLDGKPVIRYSDSGLYLVTGGLKIGKHLYLGSLHEHYISRIDLDKLPKNS